MKTIGIYLAIEPHGGGMYQYSLTIINALNSLKKSEFKIVAFCENKEWDEILPQSFQRVFYKRSLLQKVCSRVYRTIDRTDEGFRRFSSCFNPAIALINKSNCHLVIYPSQDTTSYQTKKPSLSTIHDLMHRYASHFDEYKHGEFAWRERLYRNICKYSKAILVDSEIGKKHVVDSYNIHTEKLCILPFVPPDYLSASEKIDIKRKYNLPEKYIFYPAQFWEHKNHLLLLKALHILKKEGIEVHLVLVGAKKNFYGRIIKRIETMDLAKNVSIIGYVPNDEMYSFYKEAVALAYVSLGGPTNIPPLEAMISGCPVIVSNIYAMPEQLNGAGLLTDPNSPSELALHIKTLWEDKAQRKKMIELGYKQAKLWNQSKFNERFENILESAT